jgi:hypothetical protein
MFKKTKIEIEGLLFGIIHYPVLTLILLLSGVFSIGLVVVYFTSICSLSNYVLSPLLNLVNQNYPY